MLNNNKISGIYILTKTQLFINDPTGLYTCLHFDQTGFQKHLLASCLNGCSTSGIFQSSIFEADTGNYRKYL
jgi:hypothetical protein